MACDLWREKLDAYLDSELSSTDAAALSRHMRSCSSCAADVLERVQIKRSVAVAGKRYVPSAEFRARFTRAVARRRRWRAGQWAFVLIPALLVLILSIGVNLYVGGENVRRERAYSELADLHVAALASSTPVDVVSTDRHTVKPWFQGKIPFTFNLPELQGSQFTLLGGRVTYLAQTPGAHLIYQLRKHQISVFIFQDRGGEIASLTSASSKALSFNIENWTQDGLRYFVLGDVSSDDLHALADLLRRAQ